MFYSYTKVSIKPEYRAEVIAAAQKLAQSVKTEDGYKEYQLTSVGDDEGAVAFFEIWESPEAFTAHVKAGEAEGAPLNEFGKLMAQAELASEHYDGVGLL